MIPKAFLGLVVVVGQLLDDVESLEVVVGNFQNLLSKEE